MKVLVFGPSGSGKTYVARFLQNAGINAFDTEDIEGLAHWYNSEGQKVAAPQTADQALQNRYSFLWSPKAMARFLARHEEVYVFGGSGDVSSVFGMFDKVYFLQVDRAVQEQRLQSPQRENPGMDSNREGPVTWGDWLAQLALEHHIPFVNANQSPEEIFRFISR